MTLVLAIVSAASACSGSESNVSISSADPDVTAVTTPSTVSRSEAFCVEFAMLQVDSPDSYVGSEEHLADVERLLAVAPAPIAADLSTFGDFVASGAIDSEADPDSNLVENWPADVQSAIADAQSFAEANCESVPINP